jgi:hypothetical protein
MHRALLRGALFTPHLTLVQGPEGRNTRVRAAADAKDVRQRSAWHACALRCQPSSIGHRPECNTAN